MAHHVSDGGAAVGKLDLQAVDVEDAAGPHHVLGEGALGKARIARVVVPEHEVALLGRPGEMVLKRTVAIIGERSDGVLDTIERGADILLRCGLIDVCHENLLGKFRGRVARPPYSTSCEVIVAAVSGSVSIAPLELR